VVVVEEEDSFTLSEVSVFWQSGWVVMVGSSMIKRCENQLKK
jgi:hypothetical protein